MIRPLLRGGLLRIQAVRLRPGLGQRAPAVRPGAPFTETGHASAVGKAHLSDLDFEARLDHLTRYKPVSLTKRTITDPRTLFDNLDGHGPYAPQLDLLEYSTHNLCAAISC